MVETKKRIWELDFLRGLAIIMMCFDHLMFYIIMIPDLFSNYGSHRSFVHKCVAFAYDYLTSDLRMVGHVVFVTIFLLLVGISCHFSRSNLKRGLKVFGFGAILSVGTIILELIGFNDVFIMFGILSLIGSGILLYCLVDKIPGSKLWFIILGVGITVIGLANNMFFPKTINEITSFKDFMDVIIGTRLFGADCFGLFYVGIIFIGAFLGKTIYDSRKSLLPCLDGKWNKPICFVGRNTIWVYIAAPFVLFGLIIVVCLAAGYHF